MSLNDDITKILVPNAPAPLPPGWAPPRPHGRYRIRLDVQFSGSVEQVVEVTTADPSALGFYELAELLDVAALSAEDVLAEAKETAEVADYNYDDDAENQDELDAWDKQFADTHDPESGLPLDDDD
jgi:hypothetical protein